MNLLFNQKKKLYQNMIRKYKNQKKILKENKEELH